MGLYFVMFMIVFFSACLSIKAKLSIYFIATEYILITLMLALRYGQGTDYFSYQYLFTFYSKFDVTKFLTKEPVYKYLCYLFSNIGDFELFVGIIAVVNMLMVWFFIRRYSTNATVSIMLLLPVLWLIYFGSALRQGICMAFFLGLGTKFIESRKWISYLILCTILSMIHTVSLIYFTVPFVLNFSVRTLALMIPLFTFASLVLLRIGGGGIPYTSSEASTQYFAAAERIVSFTIVFIIYNSPYCERKNFSWMNLYTWGTALYFLFLPFGLISSRLAACFKMFEIVIVPSLIKQKNRYRQIFMCYFFVLAIVMFVHGLYGAIWQGNYRNGTNALNFPYVSVFNAEDIYNYRIGIRKN